MPTLLSSSPLEPIVHYTPAAVAARLLELDLSEPLLVEVVDYAFAHAAECTAHDPPSAQGFLLWDKGIRGLRDRLVPQGWQALTEQNYPTVVHPSGLWALSVAGGDAGTGDRKVIPSTRTDKGTVTKKVARQNQSSFWGIRPDLAPQAKQTWLVLIHVDEVNDEVRAELSLPLYLGEDKRISWWNERIILSPIPCGVTPVKSSEDEDLVDSGEIEIGIVRRTG